MDNEKLHSIFKSLDKNIKDINRASCVLLSKSNLDTDKVDVSKINNASFLAYKKVRQLKILLGLEQSVWYSDKAKEQTLSIIKNQLDNI